MNLKEFLINNSDKCIGFYTLVNYENNTEVVWFSKHRENNQYYFLEHECTAIKIKKISGDIDFFCKEFISNSLIIPDETNKQKHIDKHIKILINDGWLYEINKTKRESNLPESVDEIKIISKKECLDFLIQNNRII